jgi:hypothetical protein
MVKHQSFSSVHKIRRSLGDILAIPQSHRIFNPLPATARHLTAALPRANRGANRAYLLAFSMS